MPARYPYQMQISNPYLGKVVIIKGMTKAEVQLKANQQLASWTEQEAKKHEQYRLLDLKSQAERGSQYAQERLSALREFLLRGLRTHRKFDWNALKNHSRILPFNLGNLTLLMSR